MYGRNVMSARISGKIQRAALSEQPSPKRSPTSNIEDFLRDRFGYAWALAGFEVFVMLALTVILLSGHENHGRNFHSGDLLVEGD